MDSRHRFVLSVNNTDEIKQEIMGIVRSLQAEYLARIRLSPIRLVWARRYLLTDSQICNWIERNLHSLLSGDRISISSVGKISGQKISISFIIEKRIPWDYEKRAYFLRIGSIRVLKNLFDGETNEQIPIPKYIAKLICSTHIN